MSSSSDNNKIVQFPQLTVSAQNRCDSIVGMLQQSGLPADDIRFKQGVVARVQDASGKLLYERTAATYDGQGKKLYDQSEIFGQGITMQTLGNANAKQWDQAEKEVNAKLAEAGYSGKRVTSGSSAGASSLPPGCSKVSCDWEFTMEL